MTRMAVIAAALALSAAASMAAAQHQPYAGLEARPVKALSSEEIADLRAGRGMGLALAAELNGYPGPTHLLELADKLDLSADQRAGIETLFHSMKAETIALGERLIAQETELDRQFASGSVTRRSLDSAVHAIGDTQAELRTAHLQYHLRTVALLSPHQVSRYSELRGYTGKAPSGGHGSGRH